MPFLVIPTIQRFRVIGTPFFKLNGKIEIAIEEKEKSVLISYTDTGIGMSETEVERIFARFYRADKARTRTVEGTGLGLSIVATIIKLHGGHMKVKSKEQEGSTFLIELPVK